MSLNYDKIFEVFGDEWKEGDTSTHTSYDELTDHPIYWLGMFKKIVMYRGKSQSLILETLRRERIHLDEKDLRKAGNHLAYNKAWKYVAKFDFSDVFHIAQLMKYRDDELENSLKMSIQHFEELTEYEKCAFLKKILDLSQSCRKLKK